MKNIRFRYQSIAASIQQLLLNTKSSQVFIFGLKTIVLECINVTSIFMEESDTDSTIRLAFSQLYTLLKKAITKHNVGDYDDSQSQQSRRHDPYEGDYDEVTVFLNSRKPFLQTETNRGQLYKFLSQAEDRQKDLQEILDNFSNIPKIAHQKNSKLLRQKSQKNKSPIPNPSQENIQVQTDIHMEAFSILMEERHIYQHHKLQIERDNSKIQENQKTLKNPVINESKKSSKKINGGKTLNSLQKNSMQSLLQKKEKNLLQASKKQIITHKDPQDPIADKKCLINPSKTISKTKKQEQVQRKLFSQQSVQTNQICELKSLSEMKSRSRVSVPLKHELQKELQIVQHQDKWKTLRSIGEYGETSKPANNLKPSIQVQENQTENERNFKQQQLNKTQALFNAQSDIVKQNTHPNVILTNENQRQDNFLQGPLNSFGSSRDKTKKNQLNIDIKSSQNRKTRYVGEGKDFKQSQMAMLPHINLRKSENKLQKRYPDLTKASSFHDSLSYKNQLHKQNISCSQHRQNRNLSVIDEQKQKKVMKRLQRLVGDDNLEKNSRKIQLYIQDIVSIHEKGCGKGCVHLTRFYSLLLKKNIPNRKLVKVHHKNINFEQQISRY